MADAIDIRLPYGEWWPRDHQLPLWEYLQSGGKRAMAIWHRRAGKDEVCLHHAACSAVTKPGNYWHCLPQFTQCRRAIWDAVNPHSGKRRIDEAFPLEMRDSTRDHDMHIRFKTGSTWTLIGSDEYNRAVGSSCAGLVMSEYALSNPAAWGYFRPMLEENDGWAVFVTTPRGRNHAHELFRYSARASGWFSELLTARDTGALSDQALAEALAEYQALYGRDQGEALFRQEYLCDWASGLLGSFYAREMADVREEGRILDIEPIPGKSVNTAWDLGVRDDTSIWWWQQSGSQILVLDHLATSGVGVEWYRDEIFNRESARGWIHGTDYVPHDAKVREFGSGRTRVETMQALGLRPQLVRDASLIDGINAVRRTLPLCVFHSRTEDTGISALEQYRREFDEEKKCFKASAVHDWTSHPADAFRYLSLAWQPATRIVPKPAKQQGWVILPPPELRKGIRL